MSNDLRTRVRTVVADVFGLRVEDVPTDASHDSIEGWDSMQIINLVMAVEDAFGIAVDGDDVVDFLSVPMIVALLEEKGAG